MSHLPPQARRCCCPGLPFIFIGLLFSMVSRAARESSPTIIWCWIWMLLLRSLLGKNYSPFQPSLWKFCATSAPSSLFVCLFHLSRSSLSKGHDRRSRHSCRRRYDNFSCCCRPEQAQEICGKRTRKMSRQIESSFYRSSLARQHSLFRYPLEKFILHYRATLTRCFASSCTSLDLPARISASIGWRSGYNWIY